MTVRTTPWTSTEIQTIEEFISMMEKITVEKEIVGEVSAMETSVFFRAILTAIQMELMVKDISSMYNLPPLPGMDE